MTRQRNNHARSKQKRKKFRLQNLLFRIFVNRALKKTNTDAQMSMAEVTAARIAIRRKEFDIWRQAVYSPVPGPNQRQRRKQRRQQPHGWK